MYTTSARTAGQTYYLTNTAGGIGGSPSFQSASIIPMEVGIALSTTKLLLRFRRMQRMIPFTGTRTAASGSGTQTVTVGVNIARVEIHGSMLQPATSMGWYDATAGSNYYNYAGNAAAGGGSGNCIYLQDAGGTIYGVGGISGTDFTITWTKAGAPATSNFSGLAYELI